MKSAIKNICRLCTYLLDIRLMVINNVSLKFIFILNCIYLKEIRDTIQSSTNNLTEKNISCVTPFINNVAKTLHCN